MCKRIVGLDPIVFKDSRVLILGSMPSVISLKKQMYYANKTNRFWKVLEAIYQENDKIKLLKTSHIALWDICNGRTNQNTMQKYFPNIQTVYCPSTSSANAQFSLEQLIEIYKKEIYE